MAGRNPDRSPGSGNIGGDADSHDVILSIIKDLNVLQKKAEEEGYDFLSYLLRMAVLEAQSVASTAPAMEPDANQTDPSSH